MMLSLPQLQCPICKKGDWEDDPGPSYCLQVLAVSRAGSQTGAAALSVLCELSPTLEAHPSPGARECEEPGIHEAPSGKADWQTGREEGRK